MTITTSSLTPLWEGCDSVSPRRTIATRVIPSPQILPPPCDHKATLLGPQRLISMVSRAIVEIVTLFKLCINSHFTLSLSPLSLSSLSLSLSLLFLSPLFLSPFLSSLSPLSLSSLSLSLSPLFLSSLSLLSLSPLFLSSLSLLSVLLPSFSHTQVVPPSMDGSSLHPHTMLICPVPIPNLVPGVVVQRPSLAPTHPPPSLPPLTLPSLYVEPPPLLPDHHQTHSHPF